MSQTETLLLMVLGFALATLIALFAGRLVWNTALRLGARRMQKQVPSTLVGLQTERDRLRAEFAMLSQRLGSRLEAAKLQMAEQMAEVSRHRNRLETAEAALGQRTAEVEALTGRTLALETSLAAKIEQMAELEKTVAARDEELAATHEQLRQMIAMDVSAEAHAVPAAAAAAEAVPPAEDGLRKRINKLNQMAQAGPHQRPFPFRTRAEKPRDTAHRDSVKAAEHGTEDIQKELQKLDAEWTKRLGEIKPADAASGGSSQPRAVANVISLANRIRALQKNVIDR